MIDTELETETELRYRQTGRGTNRETERHLQIVRGRETERKGVRQRLRRISRKTERSDESPALLLKVFLHSIGVTGLDKVYSVAVTLI